MGADAEAFYSSDSRDSLGYPVCWKLSSNKPSRAAVWGSQLSWFSCALGGCETMGPAHRPPAPPFRKRRGSGALQERKRCSKISLEIRLPPRSHLETLKPLRGMVCWTRTARRQGGPDVSLRSALRLRAAAFPPALRCWWRVL